MVDVGTPILAAPPAEGAKDQHMVINMGPAAPFDARRFAPGAGN